MAIDSTTAAAGQTTSAAAAAKSQIGADYNSFLKLLTAQVANQDPLKPMDSTQFISQLAQLSQVEQSVQTNTNLESIGAKLGTMAAMSDVGLMGHDVTLASDRVELRAGAANTAYQLSAPAASVEAVIMDESGTVVRTITGLPTDGGTRMALNWDGKNDSGTTLADGVYHVVINATDASGSAVSYDTYPTTSVEQVLFSNGDQVLHLRNGQDVPSALVLSVS